jgi:DNA-binding protein StpA
MSEINYKDIATFFSSSRKMKQFIKHCDLSLLIELRDTLDTAIDERKFEFEKEQEAEKQRAEKREELMALIDSEGFSLEELIAAKPKQKKSRREMKYRYTENGIVKEWSGVGRTPHAIQVALKLGDSLNSFLINKTIANKNNEETVFISDAKLCDEK